MEKLIQFQTAASRYDGPFDNIVGWAAAGMGYLLVTAHGRLIAIDGGKAEDADAWLDLLAANAPADAIPAVDLWIITHPHLDHYGALDAIARDPARAARVRIAQIACHFPAEFRDKSGHDNENHIAKMARILAATGAEPITPAVDERRTIDGMTLHFLYTPTDCSILNNPNQLSLIFTVETAAHRIMFTGDAFRRNLQIVVWRYPDSLACDILQMPHHGLCDTGLADFYDRVNPTTLLIPTSIAGWRTMHTDMYGDAPAVNRRVEEKADTIYRACDGTVEIPLGGASCR